VLEVVDKGFVAGGSEIAMNEDWFDDEAGDLDF